MAISDTLKALFELFWPTRCAACDGLVSKSPTTVCECCLDAIDKPHHVVVPRGADKAFAFFAYEGPASDLITRWKYHEDYSAQCALMGLVSNRIQEIKPLIAEHALLVPVPPHPNRLESRGFDPVWTFASVLAKGLQSIGCDAQLADNLIVRTRHTPHQAQLSYDERLKNLDGAFERRSEIPHAQLVIVDDVLTTGATISACIEQCFASASPDIHPILALAIAHPEMSPTGDAEAEV